MQIFKLVMKKFEAQLTDNDILGLMGRTRDPQNPNILYYLQIRYPQIFKIFLQEEAKIHR